MAKKKEANFESSLLELEQILEKMSRDEVSLDESIEMYAKAAALIAECSASLRSAQVRIDEINRTLQTEESE